MISKPEKCMVAKVAGESWIVEQWGATNLLFLEVSLVIRVHSFTL